ncbi:MAG: GNAT family acetyltransferase [Candidatus Bathyarchaeia archaeon]|jgi:ribosomal protein S18 acetylase RimI-like enzyme
MRIREFQLTDYDDVVGLWKTAGLILRPGDELYGIKLKLQRDPDLFLVVEDGGEIVGVVMGAWDGRRGWINHLAVKPNRQREGIGRTLMGELEKRLFEKGAKKVNAQIYKWNTKSADFFKSVGYEVHSDLVMIGKYLKK